MLGYGKDSHSYRVFNLSHYKVVETVNLSPTLLPVVVDSGNLTLVHGI